jgi:hypothetical protein
MRVLVIPDLHCPWHHAGAFDFVSRLATKFRPQAVIFLGDEIDAHGFSRYGRNPDAPGEGEELTRAVEALQPWYRRFPVARVCHSNHTLRPWKRAQESGLPAALVRPVRDVLRAPRRWEWADSWELDGVLFVHGDGFTGRDGAIKAAIQHRRSVCIGHIHGWAGVQYSGSRSGAIFGMNAGCLIDAESSAFGYAKHYATRPVLGCGVIEDGVPRFVPLMS